MRLRGLVATTALLSGLLFPALVNAGTPPVGWTRAALVHTFDQHDGDGSDLVTFNGRAYAAVAGDEQGFARLYFATNDNATGVFRKEKVDEHPAATEYRSVSISVAPNGDVYIGYEADPDVGESDVMLATDAGGSWTSVEIPSTSASGPIESPEFPDIAARSDGSVAMVFQAHQHAPCTGTGDVFLTTFTNGSFSTPTDVTLGNEGPGNRCVLNTFPAIAAAGDTLHMAYRWVSDTTGGIQLHYRSGTLTNSTDETIDAAATTIPGFEIREFGHDIVVDSVGVPHVAYVTANGDNSSFSTRYATKSGTAWVLEEVQRVSEGRSVRGPSVAVAVSQAAVAYTLDGADDDPGGSFQAQAFIAKSGAPGEPWSIANLNRGNVDDFDPEIAAAQGRFHAMYLEENGLGSLPFSFVYNHEAPKPVIDFNLTGGKLFEGGQPVPMKGDIDPATVPEKVIINTQRYRGGKWIKVDKRRTRSNARGEWKLRHAALPTGARYRARAEVGDTVDHRAGKNPWVNFLVAARRNH